MDYDVLIESETQFWEELDDIVSTPCKTHDRIDDTLRTWLSLITSYREDYVQSESAVTRCSLALLSSSLFSAHGPYIRRQLIYVLLQEDDAPTLHFVTAFLLFDGCQSEATFTLMKEESVFPRLLEMIRDGVDDELGLHRKLLELLYEMLRIQQLSFEDLTTVDDNFVLYLLRIVEELSNDVNDPYHYPVIRALLVLNEQYMVSFSTLSEKNNTGGITNRIIKILSIHGGAYRTFGENIILLFNRESETSLQLLILKLLYLLFSTPSTYEYFYTNDLHVLVDILIRNLLDLPSNPSTKTLRHTYLRVLHPLLAYTQLRLPPHYKREQLRKALHVLSNVEHTHFAPADETTVRLVRRCLLVEWLQDDTVQGNSSMPPDQNLGDGENEGFTANPVPQISEPQPQPEMHSRDSQDSQQPDSPHKGGSGQEAVANRLLGVGMRLSEARGSSLSIAEMAAQKEKPGVITPSRERDGGEHEFSVERNGRVDSGDSALEQSPFADH